MRRQRDAAAATLLQRHWRALMHERLSPAAATRLQARHRGNSLRRGDAVGKRKSMLAPYEEEDDGEPLGECAPLLPLVPIREDLQPVLADLHDQAAIVVELMREWDEDNNGTTDASEFRVALPVLDLNLPRPDADEVFGGGKQRWRQHVGLP